MGFREKLTDIEEERVQTAMQVIGDGIDWSTFCRELNVSDDEARRLVHEMGHRHLVGFAGGLVSPSIDVVRDRRLAHRTDAAALAGTANDRRSGGLDWSRWSRVVIGATVALIAATISVVSYETAGDGGTYVAFAAAVLLGGWFAINSLLAESA